jgi:ferredoxin
MAYAHGNPEAGGSSERSDGVCGSWWNLTRITTVRIVVQAVTFALFLAFVVLTTFAHLDRAPALRLWVSKVLEVDPLISIATALTTHTVYKGLLWSLVILIPTLFLGRFFCGWICPYGTIHHFAGWALGRSEPEWLTEANGYRHRQRIKYGVLIALLVAALFGSLQIGLVDPICLAYRSLTGAVLPTADMASGDVLGSARFYRGALLIGAILFGLVAMNLAVPRFFCRVLCPLGALLGVFSRFAWWRIARDPAKCRSCHRCDVHCEGACDPGGVIRPSECVVCFNCIEDCPEGALQFSFMPGSKGAVTGTDLPRRQAIFAGVVGLLFFPFVRASGANTRTLSSRVIRPPGAREELAFLERCLKCAQCIRVCPTNVLQPAGLEAGLEGLWSPVLDFGIGHCQLHCTACSQVCPSGAIRTLSIPEKLGQGPFIDRGPVRLGTAHIDPGRCLPLSKNIPCVVCEEVCPTSPKAIYTQRELRPMRDRQYLVAAATGERITLQARADMTGTAGAPIRFDGKRWTGDGTKAYYVSVRQADGAVETLRIAGNEADTLRVEPAFACVPEAGTTATIQIELRVPRVDAGLCIGCGLCAVKCPAVGNRRAVYVTADGESRSSDSDDPGRNRSVYLLDSTPS